ncbi:multiple epidermal growth factor-like domains protein 10 isoform X2 [Mizuhopecten yessoensis]|uniref:multiple epidermal growth factor-like domains protein 10 isoform X2 n=1 Tax=Mizuhopecten yessoensis TaxID=6573 RepID=UPI000B459B6A|nr:multiple epidermal growth factor-like domains protein 10 isoform X2 [Mizuhopecten yessoensis]
MEGVTIVLIGILLTLGQPGLSLLNLSKGRPTNSSDFREGKGASSLVVDGNDSDFLSDPNNAAIPQCLYTISNQKTTFWQVDLEQRVVIDHVEVISRRGGIGQRTHQIRRNGYSIIVTASSRYLPITQADICYSDTDPALSSANHENQSCSNIGRYITFYNQRETLSGSDYSLDAVLELCEVKVMGCPINKHGLNCSEDCPARCTNNLCFPGNGTCMRGCKPGYTGSACEKPCDDYFFGQNCALECFCAAGPCITVEGKCPQGGCSAGYNGTSCNTECVDGTFGDNCGSKCGHCINGPTTCHHIDGSCRSGCSPGYKVETCIEVCDPGKYGSQCSRHCGRCFNGAPCHHINGTCLTGCAAGKQGNTCDTDCTPGMYGPNCENTCGDCKGGPRTCNITDGSCPGGCAAGWQGPLCKTACDDYFFGQDCASECFCKAGPCTIVEGKCPHGGCDPGYSGTPCSTERISQDQTEVIGCHDSLNNTKDVTGYAILGTVLAIFVFYNIGLTVFYLRQSRRIKTPPKPSTAYEMQPNSVSQDHSNYEGLDITKVDNVKNIYETIGE